MITLALAQMNYFFWPPVKQGLLGDPIKLSFKQFALFSNSFK